MLNQMKDKMRAICTWSVVTLLLWPLHVFASERPAPECTNHVGETVVFATRDTVRASVAAGMANRAADGTPMVFRMNYQSAPPAFQRFIDLHECAHHQTGDVDRPHPPRNSPAHLMNESIADCVAILRIRDESQDPEAVLAELVPALRSAMADVGFPEISTDSRVANLEHCYANYGSASDYIAGVLALRRTD